MDKYKETFETWDKIAFLYEEKFMNLELYNSTYNFICDSIEKENARLLEIGCGPGNITKYLLSKRPYWDIYGIDIAPNMINLAEKNNPTASFAIMDARSINDLESGYDGIICGFCMPYLSEHDCTKLIKGCSNLLNESGLLYLSFVEGDPGNSGFQKGNGGRSFFYFHSLDYIKRKLSESSFKVLKNFKVEYKKSNTEIEIHTILIARKNDPI